MSYLQRVRSIQLFGQKHPRKAMWKRQLRQRPRKIRAFPAGAGYSVRPANDETQVAAVGLPISQFSGQLDARELPAPLIEQHDVLGRVDPVEDADTIETELMLADLESIDKRLQNLTRKVRGGDKEAVQQVRLLEAAQKALEDGKPARTVDVDPEDAKAWRMLQLLTTKPVLYVCNVAEDEAASGNAQSARVAEMAAEQGAGFVVKSVVPAETAGIVIGDTVVQRAGQMRPNFLETRVQQRNGTADVVLEVEHRVAEAEGVEGMR